MLLALGLGAGLRPSELVATKGRDVTESDIDFVVEVRGACHRIVTLRGCEATLLGELVGRRNAYLFHPEEADRSYPNFVNDFCRQLVASPDAAKFSASRARSCYICDQLASGTVLSALLAQAGIVEVESLLRYSRHVERAPQSKAALRHRLARYRCVRYLFHRALSVMDPSTQVKNRVVAQGVLDAMVKEMDENEIALRRQRLESVVNDLLEASVSVCAPEELERFDGALGLDATVIPLFSRGPSTRAGTSSSDPDGAGTCARAITATSSDPRQGNGGSSSGPKKPPSRR